MTAGELIAHLRKVDPEARVTCAGKDILAHGEAIWYLPVEILEVPDGTEVLLIMDDDRARNGEFATFKDILGETK